LGISGFRFSLSDFKIGNYPTQPRLLRVDAEGIGAVFAAQVRQVGGGSSRDAGQHGEWGNQAGRKAADVAIFHLVVHCHLFT